MDARDVKIAAAGRWRELLNHLGGVPYELLDEKNHPCPKCGGTDRFRMINVDEGALFCNQCFNKHCGDGLAALGWLTGKSLFHVCRDVAAYLGLSNGKADPVDIVTATARAKGVSVESLKAYGAREGLRGNLTVCSIPLYDWQGKQFATFDICPYGHDEKLRKGKQSYGSKGAGVFLAGGKLPDPKRVVLLVEGPKDAAALHSLKYQAVGVSTNRLHRNLARLFRDCVVIIVPDRDKAGEEGARQTKAVLDSVAKSVAIAILPSDLKESGGDDVRDVLRRPEGEKLVHQAIKDAKPSGSNGLKITTMRDACHAYVDALEAGEIQLHKCGIRPLDDAIGGFAMGEYILIGGRTSHCKTAITIQIADYYARTGLQSVFITEETVAKELGRRTLVGITRFDSIRERSPYVDNPDEVRQEIEEHYADCNSPIVVERTRTINRCIQVIEQCIAQHDARVVVVDYVQLLSAEGFKESDRIGEISKALQQCAHEHDIILIGLVQLNREVENRRKKDIQINDLKGSGQLEQDADIVILAWWPFKWDGENPRHYEMRVAKIKRWAGTSAIELSFDPPRQRFDVPDSEKPLGDPEPIPEYTDPMKAFD